MLLLLLMTSTQLVLAEKFNLSSGKSNPLSPKLNLSSSVKPDSTSTNLNQKRSAFFYPYSGPTFDLPDIIINPNNNGYHYPVPIGPPFLSDEPTPPSDAYLPPSVITPVPPSQLDDDFDTVAIDSAYLPPPVNDLTPPQYDEPQPVEPNPPLNSYLPTSNQVYRGTNSKSTNDIMSCQDTNSSRHFKARFRLETGNSAMPVIDRAVSAIISTGCLRQSSTSDLNNFDIDITGASRMNACGIRYCTEARKSLCVTVRRPQITGLRLAGDQTVTLQCRLREPVASHTKRLVVGRVHPVEIQGRSLGTVSVGGTTHRFESHVTLQRHHQGGGAQHNGEIVGAGSLVQLGEELLLRATVKPGDGWKYCRLSTVTLHQRQAPSNSKSTTTGGGGDIIDSTGGGSGGGIVTLVDVNGCRVDSMRPVCPEQPHHVDPLTVTLPMRAFMFNTYRRVPTDGVKTRDANGGITGSAGGELMVLTVRMVACLEADDCKVTACERTNQPPVHGRIRARRNTITGQSSGENGNSTAGAVRNTSTTDIETQLDFKVVLLPQEKRTGETNNGHFLLPHPLFVLQVASGCAILGILVFVLFKKCKLSASNYSENVIRSL